MSVKSIITVFSDSSPDELESALVNLAQCDNDWNGENGKGYLHDEAANAGFTSNAEYYANRYKNLGWRDAVKEYLNAWLGNDTYYTDYDWTTIEDCGNVFLSVAYSTEG